MTAPVLADALGPRGRRQARVASVVAAVVIIGLAVLFIRRLQDRGQFDPDLWRPFSIWLAWRFLLIGLLTTLKVAGLAMGMALVLGTLLALARLARSFLVRLPAVIFVEFFRGLPLYVLILFCGFGLPDIDVDISKFQALVLGLTLYNSAILGEVFRAGILSLDRGQTEAAMAIGLGYWETMLLVVVPQAFRRMIPAIVSQLVTLLKDTSLGFVILVEELLRRAQLTGEFFGNPLQAYSIAAVMYIIVNYSLSRLARRLEIRQRRRYSAGAIQVTGVEDLAVVGAQADAVTARDED
ncbi:MAG TPA: amino acid ABC transporter permease [Acidimicrobiales bacterium]